MPRMTKICAKDFDRVAGLAEELHANICDVINAATKGYHEELESPDVIARTFLNLAGSCIKISQFLNGAHDLKVQRAAIEAMVRKQAASE